MADKYSTGPFNTPKELLEACRYRTARLQTAAREKGVALQGAGWVDTHSLQSEVRAVKKLLGQFTFSEDYKRWSAGRRQRLVKELCASESFCAAARSWPALKQSDRYNEACRLANGLQRIFSHNATLFPPKSIAMDFYEAARPASGENAYFLRATATSVLGGWKSLIRVNTHQDTGFNDFYTAMDTIFHENLHAVHQILREHNAYGGAKGHRFEYDMEMLANSHTIKWSALSQIRSLYHALPWERDSFRQSKMFTRELREELHRVERDFTVTPPVPR